MNTFFQSGMIPMVKQKQEPDSMRDPNITESWIRFTPNPSNHMQVKKVIYWSLSCQIHPISFLGDQMQGGELQATRCQQHQGGSQGP